jgi:hypothetical protein
MAMVQSSNFDFDLSVVCLHANTILYMCEKKVSIHRKKVDVDIFKGGKTNHQMNASKKVSSNSLVGLCNMPSPNRLILK